MLNFVVEHLEIIVAVTGGISFGGFMLFSNKHEARDNDLTQLYIKHKRYGDSINKTSKTLF